MISHEQTFRVDGKRALVTGGASGIGESTCRALTAAGATVIIADMDRVRAEALAAELPGASVLIVDITDESRVAEKMGTIEGLDVLVNSAGIGLVGSIEETEAEDFRRLFRVNVEGTYLVTKALLPALLRSQGCIVNVGSVAGQVGIKRRFAYCATKGAVIALSRQMAVEYAGRLRVNVVCPGTVDTPFVEGFLEKFHKHEKEKMRVELAARQPVGRLGQPDEIAHLILYLCSPAAGFVTGSAMTIDGGWTAQ